MAGELRFDGRVALVTGAGNGLGKEYALKLAERGAKVVVNDLGGDIKGGGKSSAAADQVVAEIRAKGGVAVANYDSVTEGAKLVQTALDNFGRIDIVINNAGILRDRSFPRTSDSDWDIVNSVHLKGSFMVSRAAFPHMKKQEYGRIIMTTSGAGLYGNYGQANYSSAKMGMVGLGLTIGIEGGDSNVKCNIIAPLAGSRLTTTVMTGEMIDGLKPIYIMPAVLYLCHESCEDNGSIVELGGGYFSKLRWQKSKGVGFNGTEEITPEMVRTNWANIGDFTEGAWSPKSTVDGKHVDLAGDQSVNTIYPDCLSGDEKVGVLPVGRALQEFLTRAREKRKLVRERNVLRKLEDISDGSGPGYLNMLEREEAAKKKAGATAKPTSASASSSGPTPDALINFKLPDSVHTYTERDVTLYALGVGVTTRQEDFLKFLFELNEDFCTLPSYGTVIGFGGMSGLIGGEGIPVQINPTQLLHGEQYLELHQPLPTSGTLHSKTVISDVLDKGTGAAIIIDMVTYDEAGNKIASNQSNIFVRKMGGWGGRKKSDKLVAPVDAPNRPPDASIQEQTHVDQAALYRLSGDPNPLHIDPDFAAMGGFDRPILHGLCSFGISAKHVLQQYCNNDVTKFKAIKVRFSKPVLPGETLQTDMWKEGNRIHFQTKVVESGNVCLTGAYVDIVGDASQTQSVQAPSSGLQSDALFMEMEKRLRADPSVVKKVAAVYQWNITKDGKPATVWTVDVKNGGGAVYRGEPKEGKAGCTLTLSDADFMDLATGKLNGQQAFMTGKLKIKGNVMLSQKLGQLFRQSSQL